MCLACDLTDAPSHSITKYTTAGQALNEVLKKLIPQITAGKKVLELSIEYVVLLV